MAREKNKQESQLTYKLKGDNECPNCGHFSYRAENNNTGIMPYIIIFIGNSLLWLFIDWITIGLLKIKYYGLIENLGICSFILMIIFKKQILPTKKAGEFLEFKCTNCNYKNNLEIL